MTFELVFAGIEIIVLKFKNEMAIKKFLDEIKGHQGCSHGKRDTRLHRS